MPPFTHGNGLRNGSPFLYTFQSKRTSPLRLRDSPRRSVFIPAVRLRRFYAVLPQADSRSCVGRSRFLTAMSNECGAAQELSAERMSHRLVPVREARGEFPFKGSPAEGGDEGGGKNPFPRMSLHPSHHAVFPAGEGVRPVYGEHVTIARLPDRTGAFCTLSV